MVMHAIFVSFTVYCALRRLDKERENAAALAVLPDLLRELDAAP